MHYRKLWIKHNGPIPKDAKGRSYEIHHINGDHSDNRLENLQLLSIEEHYNVHLSQEDYKEANLIAKRFDREIISGYSLTEEEKQKKRKPHKKLPCQYCNSEVGEGRLTAHEKACKQNPNREHTFMSEQGRLNVKKNSARQVGVSLPAEVKAKISKSLTGRTQTEESNRKRRESRLGSKHSPETLLKLKKPKSKYTKAQPGKCQFCNQNISKQNLSRHESKCNCNFNTN